MGRIKNFSNEVKDQLKHYVYRLVDPRNGQTFYVGEGCGDRVFTHVNIVDYNEFYNSKNLQIQDQPTDDNEDPAKIKRILEIKNKGLEVIHIIQRWGMDSKTAFEVESAFIDYFGLQELTNKVKGHNFDRGMRWTDELEKALKADIFDDYPNNNCPKFILIKINDYSLNHNDWDIYKSVRGDWSLKSARANNYPYVLAVRYGIVIGVYKIYENGWKKCANSNRIYFDGEEAPESIKKRFLDKKIPDRFRRRQNPTSYCD